jgi:Raf kinase inhibitor-like YbhB/YbcL family protein
MEHIVKTLPLNIGSPAFGNKDYIPAKYTCQGENVNPAITIENIPSETKSLVVIVDDPDAPGGIFNHWVMWNIHPMEMIKENTSPGVEGQNSFGSVSYKGPCPPEGTHRYFFKVYALDVVLSLRPGADKKQVEKAMEEHILTRGELMGLYKKTKTLLERI